MSACKHKWVRYKDEWDVFQCSKCKVIGWFKRKLHKKFEIVPYVCQKYKCTKFVTKINEAGERYCDEHYIDKVKQDVAIIPGNRRHEPVDPAIYYENFTGKKH